MDAAPVDAPPDAPLDGTPVGPAGGTVAIDGGLTLEVPPGALDEEVRIRARIVNEGFPPLPGEGAPAFGPVYEIVPHGLTFAAPARLRIPHETRVTPRLTIYTAEEGGSWAPVTSAVTASEAELVTDITHLSYFTHNWTCEPPYEDEDDCACYHPLVSLGGSCRLHLEIQPDICCPGPPGELFCAYGREPGGGRIHSCCAPVSEGCSCPAESVRLAIPDGTGTGQIICYMPSAVGKCVAPTCY